MNSADFLHADCEAIIFGQTDIVLYIFDFKMPVYCSCTSWTPSSSRKIVFLELGHQVSVNFGMVLENLIKLYVRFFGKTFLSPKIGKWAKKWPKIVFFTLKKKLVINLFYNENLSYLLCFCTNFLFGKNIVHEIQAKILSTIQIARFLIQAFFQSKSMKLPYFFVF